MTRALYRHKDLRRLLAPRSIAIVGASARETAFGHRVLANLQEFGGAVYPINGRHQVLGGRPCYPTLAELPEVPDCVILATPRHEVEALVRECARLGVGGVVVFASGFAEMGTDARIREQAALVALAQGAGVRLVGPNCIGLVNWRLGVLGTFIRPLRGQVPAAPGVGLVSQSGALGFALAQASEHGLNLSHVLTCGNSADVDVADYVAYLAEDEDCAAIACVFEGMAEPMRLIEAAGLARRAGKALVVYKIATGEQGAAAAMSHTGSLAGANDAYLAAFARAGIVVVHEFERLLEAAAFFAKAGRCRASGLAVASSSGGAAIMAADKAEQHGVPLPQPDAATTAVLTAAIPEFGAARNPCDITAQIVSDPESFHTCAEAFLKSPDYGALVVPFVFAYEPLLPRIEQLDALARAHGKPVCIVWLPQWLEGPGAREVALAGKVAMFRSMDSCLAAIAHWQRWSQPTGMDAEAPAERQADDGLREVTAAVLRAHDGAVIGERIAKDLLARYGVSMVQDVLTTTVQDCADAAARVGYPVVLKVESALIPHKTEAGVVQLGLNSEAELREAYAQVMHNALRVAAPEDIRGVIVQPMIGEGVEVIVGARIDRQFGPMVVVGLGGILVELLRDSVVELAPVSPAEAAQMLRRLKGFRLLQGFRGSAPVDIEALARAVAAISRFASDHATQLVELDVNPLICTADRIVGVDALIVRR